MFSDVAVVLREREEMCSLSFSLLESRFSLLLGDVGVRGRLLGGELVVAPKATGSLDGGEDLWKRFERRLGLEPVALVVVVVVVVSTSLPPLELPGLAEELEGRRVGEEPSFGGGGGGLFVVPVSPTKEGGSMSSSVWVVVRTNVNSGTDGDLTEDSFWLAMVVGLEGSVRCLSESIRSRFLMSSLRPGMAGLRILVAFRTSAISMLLALRA